MLKINKVIPATANNGDGDVLQPAAPLSDEVRAQLFDEFAPQPLPVNAGVSSQVIVGGLLLATALAIAVLYILKRVQPYEHENSTHS